MNKGKKNKKAKKHVKSQQWLEDEVTGEDQ